MWQIRYTNYKMTQKKNNMFNTPIENELDIEIVIKDTDGNVRATLNSNSIGGAVGELQVLDRHN